MGAEEYGWEGWERVGLHRCRHRDCHQMSSESKECGEKRGGGEEGGGVKVEIIERQKSQRSFQLLIFEALLKGKFCNVIIELVSS